MGRINKDRRGTTHFLTGKELSQVDIYLLSDVSRQDLSTAFEVGIMNRINKVH